MTTETINRQSAEAAPAPAPTAAPRSEEECLQDAVRPLLHSLEDKRGKMLRMRKLWVPVTALGGLAAGQVLGSMGGGDVIETLEFLAYVVMVAGPVLVMTLASAGYRRWLSLGLLPPVAKALGMTYEPQAPGFAVDHLVESRLFGKFDRSDGQDLIRGTHHDVAFAMARVRIDKRSSDEDGSRTTTVFDGQILKIDVPRPVPGRIVITRDAGALGKGWQKIAGKDPVTGLPRVETGHAAFEPLFDLHAEDPEAARAFLGDGFLDAMVRLAEAEGGDLMGAFVNGVFILAIPRRRTATSHVKLSMPAHEVADDVVRGLTTELATAHRVIDTLRGG